MIEPSTPVTKGGAICNGKDVAEGVCELGAFDEDATGMSKAIFVMLSWSRTSKDGNLRFISL